jgi:hypothetical protein
MKLLRITILLCAGQGWVAGQGAINFNTRAPNLNPEAVNAPIYGPEPSPSISLHGNHITNGGSTIYNGVLLTGTGFTAQLWAAPEAQGLDALAPIVTTTMRPPGAFAGHIIPPIPPATAPTINNAPGGSQVIFELRVWDNQNNTVTSWAMVMANSFVLRGTSGYFITGVTEPPYTPPNLVGLTSFNLFLPVAASPEPSILALAGLAFSAYLLLRRRK